MPPLAGRRSPRVGALLLRLLSSDSPALQRLSWGRAGIGAVMIAKPTSLPGVLGVDSASAGRVTWAVQMLGAREVALGVGSSMALRRAGAAGAAGTAGSPG
ncbi:MAG: hypothetical protein M3N21_01195, partial [Actinomycetota bacterium]|nr:hypothetical protein [Actinomycetota bacterium]